MARCAIFLCFKVFMLIGTLLYWSGYITLCFIVIIVKLPLHKILNAPFPVSARSLQSPFNFGREMNLAEMHISIVLN